MRESRQVSTISSAQKLKYPRCDKKKEHGKESLNLVCLTSNCKHKGLICLQCKTAGDHPNHNVQPLRTFLTKLEDSLKRIELERSPKMEENPSNVIFNERTVIQRLEEQHLQMMSLLKLQIEQMAEMVRVMQDELIRQYSKMKEKICVEFEKQTLINKTLAQIQGFFAEPEREGLYDIKFSVSKLLALVKIDKNEISVLNESEMQLNSYILSAKTFKNNMLVWQRESGNIIRDIFKSKPQYQLKQTQIRPTTAVDSTNKNVSLAFSPQLKTQSIGLQKDNKIAKVKDDKNLGKIILLNQAVLDYKSTPVKFKMLSLFGTSTIQVGICLRSHITQKLYKFQKNVPVHGLFVISSNGYTYSSADPMANNIKGQLLFKSGDEISVEVDAKQNKIIFKKKSDSKTVEINLKHVAQIDWKELYFCVGMSSLGDKVQILS